MSKKMILVLVAVFFFFGFNLARASVIINEIMYAPENVGDYEWMEIFNDSNEQINLDGWRFFNSESISAPLRTSGSFILEPHAFALITSNKSLFSFSGQIFTSSQFSLPGNSSKYNTYKGIFLDSNKNTGDSIIYDTNLGGSVGTSLSKINGSWISGIPTPGAINQTLSSNLNNNENLNSTSITTVTTTTGGSGSASSSTTSESKPKVVEIPKIKTQIIVKTLGFVGFPLSFQGITFGLQGEQLNQGKYFWNFGDGDSKEVQVVSSQQFSHTYFYPGEYVVSLFYYSNPYIYQDVPDAFNQITIKIISADISISRVGDEKDFFIELTNNTSYDADISNWILASDQKSFTIPRNTILAPKKAIIISSQITHFSIEDKNTLKLMTPQGRVVFDYPSSIALTVPTKTIVQPKVSTAVQPPEEAMSALGGQIPAENLSALALQSGIADSNNSQTTPPARAGIIFVISLVFVGASAGAVYFIRQKKIVPNAGDDFNILDE